MRIVCDADGLIKMQKAGLLALLAQEAELLIGPQVFQEAVTEGKQRGYADAAALEQLLEAHAIRPRPVPAHPRATALLPPGTFGEGERETLHLYYHAQADGILSDDRGFLTLLTAQQIPFFTPAAALVALGTWGVLAVPEAFAALERLRPLIRQEHYAAAHADVLALAQRSSHDDTALSSPDS